MAVKYYTQFLVADAGKHRHVREYSGVVEVSRSVAGVEHAREIERLLARNLHCDTEQVRVINWARLH